MNEMKRITAAAAALITIFGCAAAPGGMITVLAESSAVSSEKETENTVHISSAEDFIKFSSDCVYDKYSKGKKFVLDCDISLEGFDFQPVPSFSGEFDGSGHIITNLKLGGEGSEQGLFRYIEQSGCVKDLRVTGRITPDGSAEKCGGIAGVNRGRIINCSFSGTVIGKGSIGGITGVNEDSGLITTCTSEGVLKADHFTGGITGQNMGTIINCSNMSSVNTTVSDGSFSLDDIDLDTIKQTEGVNNITDTGGIAGFSSGSLQSCTNKGRIGYQHVGYNVGGIVGRQSGYVSGCVNYGEINGRKDIGGIAGQAEPYVSIFFAEKKLDTLRTQLNDLSDTLDETITHVEQRSDITSANSDDISDSLNSLKNSTDSFLDETDRIINYDIASVNELSSRLSDMIDMLAPASDSLSDASASISDSLDRITEAVDLLKESMEEMDKGFDELEFLTDDLTDAVTKLREASDSIGNSLDSLQAALGDPAAMERAMNSLSGSLDDMSLSLNKLSDSCSDAVTALTDSLSEASEIMGQYSPDIIQALRNISAYADRLAGNVSSAGEYIDDLGNVIQSGSTDPDDYSDDIIGIQSSIGSMANNAASGLLSSIAVLTNAVNNIISDGFEEEYNGYISSNSSRLPDIFYGIGDDISDTGSAAGGVMGALSDITGELDPLSFDDMIEYLKTTNDHLDESADYIQNIIDSFDYAGDHFDNAFASALAAVTAVSDASDDIISASDSLTDSLETISDTLDYFSSLDKVDFIGADDALVDARDLVSDDLDLLLDLLKDAEGILDGSVDILADDAHKINEQTKAAYNTLIDIIDDMSDTSTDIEDYTEDISAEDTYGRSDGKIVSCMNFGEINGDVSVGGIAGTMSVEMDFDPEGDIETIGDNSADFLCKSKTVTRDSENHGNVTSKKDGAGGIVGSIETGCLINCTAYGSISSTDGDYVGGVAGKSSAAIYGCNAMVHLSGGDYVGGISGTAKDMADCISFVLINESGEYTGMTAGFADDEGSISGNIFVDSSAVTGMRSVGGIDGISYEGKAFPVTFEEMSENYKHPAAFTELKLTYTADGKTVAELPFEYGGSISEDDIPDIPHISGFFADWLDDDIDYSMLTFPETIEAEYSEYITSVSSAEKRDEIKPVIIAEGAFGSTDSISAEPMNKTSADCTEWKIILPKDNSDEHTIRYLPHGDPKNTALIVNGEEIISERDGSYLVFRTKDNELTICEKETGRGIVILISSCCAAAAVILAVIIISAKKKKPKPSPENKKDEKTTSKNKKKSKK
ncbi:MAG: hypothetical protein ACI4XF_06305 [Oscillospiraceae bacterium]